MVNAVLSQLQICDDEDAILFTGMYIRHMAIRHFLEHYEQLKENIEFGIETEYGRPDSEVGPFSIMTWCQEMIKDKVYGDVNLLKLIASMWSCKLTVVRADSLTEMRIRHDLCLDKAEMVVVFNGAPVSGHYCGAIKGTCDSNFMKLDCKKVVRHVKYDKSVDVMERLERKDVVWDLGGEVELVSGDKVLVDRKEYEMLKRKAAQLDQVQVVLGGGQGTPLPPLPSLTQQQVSQGAPQPGTSQAKQHEGREDALGQKKKRAKTDFQKSRDIPTYTSGDTDCSKCPFKGKTTHALKLHIMKYHENEYLYVCEICEKGFTQKEGYNNHQLVHADESERVPCEVEDCDVTFVSRRNMKAHVKNMHGSRRFFVCQHCNSNYHTRGNLTEHVKGCKKNPDRIPLYCDICPVGKSPTFYLEKRVNEHKRNVHGWK